MSRSGVTISISVPLALSIAIEEYLEKNRMSRSEFVRNSIETFLRTNDGMNENEVTKIIEKIYEDVKIIKNAVVVK